MAKRLSLSDGNDHLSGWTVTHTYEKGLKSYSHAFGNTWFVETILGGCGILG